MPKTLHQYRYVYFAPLNLVLERQPRKLYLDLDGIQLEVPMDML